MCGRVRNVKLRLIKPLQCVPDAVVGQVYEPCWYMSHDMNRVPCEPIVYFSRGKSLDTYSEEDWWAARLSDFEDAS